MENDRGALRLPDLPNDGYSTVKQKTLSDALMLFIRGMERERLTMLTIVLGGIGQWRRIARKAFRYTNPDDGAIDAVYHYFELMACEPRYQRQLLHWKNNPQMWRDVMREAWPDIEQQQKALALMEKWTPFERNVGGFLG